MELVLIPANIAVAKKMQQQFQIKWEVAWIFVRENDYWQQMDCNIIK